MRPVGESRGFTLLELLVVLAAMALLTAITIPMFSSGTLHQEIRIAAREIATGLRRARSMAVTANDEATFSLDVDQRIYSVNGRSTSRLTGALELSLYTARSELRDGAVGTIRFFPDGSSTGGRVSIKRAGTAAPVYEVRIEWLTGHVTIGERNPKNSARF